MGIAWLLLKRTFAEKPKRTLLFLIGYALATAVMVTLLAVGEAVLQQARDKDLLGGGDLVLVPQGIDLESMKVGGMSALYYSIPQARFIIRQLLSSSRFDGEIDVISPYIAPKLAYIRPVRTSKPPLHAFAEGSLPDQENSVKQMQNPWRNNQGDRAWLDPPAQEFYHEIDRFHLPEVTNADMSRWAEWHYFNFVARDFYGYLSIMMAGDILTDQGRWIVQIQMYDSTYKKYSATFPAAKHELPLKRIDYKAGPNQIRFDHDHYEIELDFQNQAPVTGKLFYYPAKGLYFPPTLLAKRDDFESGYVIPAIRGKYFGSIRIAGKIYSFDQLDGYHDHNWGFWRRTEWNWGQVLGNDFSIFFGEIYVDRKSKGFFAAIYDKKGFLTFFKPEGIKFSNDKPMPGNLFVPQTMEFQAQKRFASMRLQGEAERTITTQLEDSPFHFVQYKMNYTVELTIDGKQHRFSAPGNAETFVKSR